MMVQVECRGWDINDAGVGHEVYLCEHLCGLYWQGPEWHMPLDVLIARVSD